MSLATAMRLFLPLSFVKSTRQTTLPYYSQGSDIPSRCHSCIIRGDCFPNLALTSFSLDIIIPSSQDFQAASGEERDLWLRTDTIAAYEMALAQRNYERVTLVGKSIGTRAIGHLLATEEPLPSLRCVWLTPILRSELLRNQIKQRPHRALFVVGTADSHYDPAKLVEVQQATAGQAMVIDKADHSLEITGDIVQSIHILEGLITEIQKFLE